MIEETRIERIKALAALLAYTGNTHEQVLADCERLQREVWFHLLEKEQAERDLREAAERRAQNGG